MTEPSEPKGVRNSEAVTNPATETSKPDGLESHDASQPQSSADSQSGKKTSIVAKLPRCKFFCSLAVLVVLNLCFAALNPFTTANAINLPSQHTWEWWRAQSFSKMSNRPDVVVLGSSLVMIPLAVRDADYMNIDVDAVHHPESVYMQDQLNRALGLTGISCTNFGLPGGMISDDYVISRALFNGEKAPRIVVVGITLRDFIENHVPYPAATQTFRYFQHFFSIDDIAVQSMPEFWQRLEYWLGKALVMWGKRLEIQLSTSSVASRLIAPIESEKVIRNPVDAVEQRQNVAAKLKTVAEEGDFVLKTHQVYPFEDNSNEYRKRLKSPNKQLFKVEVEFLDKLVAQVKSSGSQLLLVNMPLTPMNMNLMPPGSYAQYMRAVKERVLKDSIPYLDLNDGKSFATSDFRDSAHMNGSGGEKLVDAIVAKIQSEPALRNAIENRQ